MNTSSQKRIASELMKCGVSRVRITQNEEVEEALTREDIRDLIQKKMIIAIQKKGTSKFASKKKLEQKKKGRKRGAGRRKGTKGARKNDKTKWIEKVRPLRKLLADLKQAEQVSTEDYGILYRRVKGGFFRNKSHLMIYLKEHDMIKPGISKKQAMEKIALKHPVGYKGTGKKASKAPAPKSTLLGTRIHAKKSTKKTSAKKANKPAKNTLRGTRETKSKK